MDSSYRSADISHRYDKLELPYQVKAYPTRGATLPPAPLTFPGPAIIARRSSFPVIPSAPLTPRRNNINDAKHPFHLYRFQQ